MYVTQTNACNQPNSETPMTQARIDAQARRVNRMGKHFVDGNSTMSSLIAALTPPAPAGGCDDLLNSNALDVYSPFPNGGSGVPGIVTPAAASMSTSPLAQLPGSAAPIPAVASLSNSGVNYPVNLAQSAIARLVPAACPAGPNSGASGVVAAANAATGSAALWWGLGAIALLGLALATGDKN